MIELVKIQSETDILLAKVIQLEKKAEDNNVINECVKDKICEGNCEHVGCRCSDSREEGSHLTS